MKSLIGILVSTLLLAGCNSYQYKPDIPVAKQVYLDVLQTAKDKRSDAEESMSDSNKTEFETLISTAQNFAAKKDYKSATLKAAQARDIAISE